MGRKINNGHQKVAAVHPSKKGSALIMGFLKGDLYVQVIER